MGVGGTGDHLRTMEKGLGMDNPGLLVIRATISVGLLTAALEN